MRGGAGRGGSTPNLPPPPCFVPPSTTLPFCISLYPLHIIIPASPPFRQLNPPSKAPPKDPPDPYVSLLLLPPERGRGSKRRTAVQRKTLNPDFNER